MGDLLYGSSVLCYKMYEKHKHKKDVEQEGKGTEGGNDAHHLVNINSKARS